MKRILAFAALALLSAAPVAAGDLYVVESTAASLPAGSFAADDAQIALAGGETVTLLDEGGATLVISGPYSGSIAGASEAPSALSRISAGRSDSGHVVGAIRAPAWDQE